MNNDFIGKIGIIQLTNGEQLRGTIVKINKRTVLLEVYKGNELKIIKRKLHQVQLEL